MQSAASSSRHADAEEVRMSVRFELLVIGSVVALAGGAAVAATLPPPVASQPAVLRVADTDCSTTKDRYIEKTQSTLDEWRRKLNATADDAGAHARATGNAADADLNAAWQKTQAAAKQVATASASQWDKAKSSFERASQDLTDRWNRAHPDNK
jgi:hypothetical protein